MINWLRRKLGLCVHEWNVWCPIYGTDQRGFRFQVASRRACKLCPAIETIWPPDGH
jgi:hypothetical protein